MANIKQCLLSLTNSMHMEKKRMNLKSLLRNPHHSLIFWSPRLECQVLKLTTKAIRYLLIVNDSFTSKLNVSSLVDWFHLNQITGSLVRIIF